MKKVLFLLFICLLLTGCNKEKISDSRTQSEFLNISKSQNVLVDFMKIYKKPLKEIEQILSEKATLVRTTEFENYTEKLYKFEKSNIEVKFDYSKIAEGFSQTLIYYLKSAVCDESILPVMGIYSDVVNIKQPFFDSDVGKLSWGLFDKNEQYFASFSCIGDKTAAIVVSLE